MRTRSITSAGETRILPARKTYQIIKVFAGQNAAICREEGACKSGFLAEEFAFFSFQGLLPGHPRSTKFQEFKMKTSVRMLKKYDDLVLTCVVQAPQVSMEVCTHCFTTWVTVMSIVMSVLLMVPPERLWIQMFVTTRCEEMHAILFDSGADASIFPSSLAGKKGAAAGGTIGKFHGAQGVGIRTQSIQDMEIRLGDLSGRNILLRERVASSGRISQPICMFWTFAGMLWCVRGTAPWCDPLHCWTLVGILSLVTSIRQPVWSWRYLHN